MKKSDIIKLVLDSGADKELKDMVISYINFAYDAGFQDGMMRGAQLQSQVFDSLMGIKKGK